MFACDLWSLRVQEIDQCDLAFCCCLFKIRDGNTLVGYAAPSYSLSLLEISNRIISGFALSPLAAAYGFLALLPFQLFSIEVWRLITCNFVGKNVLLFAWTVWSLHFGTNLIRQNNSNESLLKIYALTQVTLQTSTSRAFIDKIM